MDSQLNFLPFQIDILLVQPISQVRLQRWQGVTNWKANPPLRLKVANWYQISVILSSAYHTKQLNPWSITPTSHVVIYSWLSICPREMEPFKDHPSTRGCLIMPQKLATAKAPWVTFSTSACLNYYLMYSISVCLAFVCMEASLVKSSHIYPL